MANNPKKTKDPTEVALSAIQDALDMREGDRPADRRDAVRPPPEDDLFMDPAGGAPDRGDQPPPRRAANDDRANIGQILQTLQRRPARTPYVVAGAFSAAWVVCALGLAYSYQGAFDSLVAQGSSSAPLVIGLLAGFFAPVVFLFVLAHMLARKIGRAHV